MAKISVNSNIRKRRLEKNLSQEYMSACLGITQSSYGKYEKEGRNITLGTLLKLAEILETDLTYFVTDHSSTPQKKDIEISMVQEVQEIYGKLTQDTKEQISFYKTTAEFYKNMNDNAMAELKLAYEKIGRQEKEIEQLKLNEIELKKGLSFIPLTKKAQKKTIEKP